MDNSERLFHRNGELPLGDEIFTFGSNSQGVHGAGAAKVALDYGAKMGVGAGISGNTYAIATRDYTNRVMTTLPLLDVAISIEKFCQYTLDNPDKYFFVTAVGCGHAGFKEELIVPLFRTAVNCNFPEHWEPLFEVADTLHHINNMVDNTLYKPDDQLIDDIVKKSVAWVMEELTPASYEKASQAQTEHDNNWRVRSNELIYARWRKQISQMYKDQELKGPDDVEWNLYSFYLKKMGPKDILDTKPNLNFPVGPYWVGKNNLIRAYLPAGVRPGQYWSYVVEGSELLLKTHQVGIEFSTMYPKPEWWPFESSLPNPGVQLVDARAFHESTEPTNQEWIRYRFFVNPDDYRPITFPPPGPYWCSGSTDEYNICIAYLPPDVDIKTYWPEAVIDFEQHRESITYTDRFPKPEWWND